MNSRVLSFLKFGSILNIIFGIFVFIGFIFIGSWGYLLNSGNLAALKSLVPDEFMGDFDKVIMYLNDGTTSLEDAIAKVVGEGGQLPSFLENILSYDIDILLMGFGFGLAAYIFIVHFFLTGILLAAISKTRRGYGRVSRLFAILVSLLSIIPFVFTGVFMLLGSFGRLPKKILRNPYGERRPRRVRHY